MRIAILALAVVAVAASAGAQEPLACGVPRSRALAAGAAHTYEVTGPAGATVVLQTSDVSGTLGPVRMEVSGPGGLLADTCIGIVKATLPSGPVSVRVSQCLGSRDGQYTIVLNGVSDDPGNCGVPLPCGATADGTRLAIAGEVDSFILSLTAGVPVSLRVNYTKALSAPSLRLFDPDGNEVFLEGRCGGQIAVNPTRTGIYTALVSACAAPVQQPYRIEFNDPTCPAGPVITTFGVANATNEPQSPIGYDPFGRPIFHHAFGQGFSLVLEARAGANRRNPGVYPAPYFVSGELRPPDMEMIVSRPLGNGSPVVCDTFPPLLGGVPATEPFVFGTGAAALDIVHDMGCRFVDGTGQLIARQSSLEACTRSDEGFGFGFVDRGSRLQFCGLIATSWSFPAGDTVVAARIRDNQLAEFGAPREIVLRIGDPAARTPSLTPTPTPTGTPIRTPTASRSATPIPTHTRTTRPSNTPTETPPTIGVTATETRTRTPSRTRTPTRTPATPLAPCPGDCNGDRVVTIVDLTQVLNVAIGQAPLSQCPAADASGDGQVAIGDVIACVNAALNGCP